MNCHSPASSRPSIPPSALLLLVNAPAEPMTSPPRFDAATPIVRIDEATIGYDAGHPLLSEVRLALHPGEVIALVGTSGIGKTTLLKTVAGLVRPIAGRVTVHGATRPSSPPRGTLGMIPQRLGLVAHTSALDNVLMGALHREPAWRNVLRVPSRAALADAEAALDSVGLRSKAGEPIHRLSGGQQRRVAVARALVQRPLVLLADEFLSELDRETAIVVEEAVMRLAETVGTAILFVEHHVHKARRLADRVYQVEGGRLVDITDPATARVEPPDHASTNAREVDA